MNDEILAEHMKEDARFQEEQRSTNEQLIAKIDGLATKEDIKQVLEFMKSVNTTVGIFRFTWNNAAQIGSVLGLIVAGVLFVKYGFLGLITFFVGPHKP